MCGLRSFWISRYVAIMSMLLSCGASGYYVGEVDGAGSCTYNFQVWSTDDNLVFKLQHLESKIVNASLHASSQILTLENRVLGITNQNQNLSAHLEAELMKYR